MEAGGRICSIGWNGGGLISTSYKTWSGNEDAATRSPTPTGPPSRARTWRRGTAAAPTRRRRRQPPTGRNRTRPQRRPGWRRSPSALRVSSSLRVGSSYHATGAPPRRADPEIPINNKRYFNCPAPYPCVCVNERPNSVHSLPPPGPSSRSDRPDATVARLKRNNEPFYKPKHEVFLHPTPPPLSFLIFFFQPITSKSFMPFSFFCFWFFGGLRPC